MKGRQERRKGTTPSVLGVTLATRRNGSDAGQPPAMRYVGWAVSAILFATVVAAVSATYFYHSLPELGLGLLIALASIASGGLVGFLFAIPRSLPSGSSGVTGADGVGNLVDNSNLEQISDWLTKILVGVGLIEMRQIADAAQRLVVATGAAFGPPAASSQVLAGSLLVTFGVTGFLLGYVVTRTMVTETFRRFGPEVKSMVRAQVQEEHRRNSKLTDLVSQQLDPQAPEPDADHLLTALRTADQPAREQAFLLAQNIRRSARDRRLQQRTVPILRALTEVSDARYRYWAELGSALADADPARYDEALLAFDRAISLRGDPQGDWYEFNRAKVRLALSGGRPDETAEGLIRQDLEIAMRNPKIKARVMEVLRDPKPQTEAEGQLIAGLRQYLPPGLTAVST